MVASHGAAHAFLQCVKHWHLESFMLLCLPRLRRPRARTSGKRAAGASDSLQLRAQSLRFGFVLILHQTCYHQRSAARTTASF
jgi:hypothetical protein